MGTKRNILLAGLMCAALAACGTTDSGTTASGEPYGSAYGSSGASSSGSAYGAGTSTSQSTAMATPGVVVLIETIPRAQAGAMDHPASATTSQSGASGTAGVTSSDVAYRVTVRLDDGTTRVMTQQAAPAFQTGDRVRMGSDGVLQRY